MEKELILIGVFLGGSGLKGELKFTYFGDTLKDLKSYSCFWLKSGEPMTFKAIRPLKELIYKVTIEGITTRTQADALKGTQIYIKKEQLLSLDQEDVFYTSLLIGCRIETETGTLLGSLLSIDNYGSTDILEGGTFRLPFTKEAVPHIDLENKRLVVCEAFVIYDNDEKKG